MIDEDGKIPSEKDILHEALIHLKRADSLLFKLESEPGQSVSRRIHSDIMHAISVYVELCVYLELSEDKNLIGVDLTED